MNGMTLLVPWAQFILARSSSPVVGAALEVRDTGASRSAPRLAGPWVRRSVKISTRAHDRTWVVDWADVHTADELWVVSAWHSNVRGHRGRPPGDVDPKPISVTSPGSAYGASAALNSARTSLRKVGCRRDTSGSGVPLTDRRDDSGVTARERNEADEARPVSAAPTVAVLAACDKVPRPSTVSITSGGLFPLVRGNIDPPPVGIRSAGGVLARASDSRKFAEGRWHVEPDCQRRRAGSRPSCFVTGRRGCISDVWAAP